MRDAQGNVVTTGSDATQTITASLNVGTGTLAGDVDIAAAAGVATFTDLNINLVGTNEVLRFSAGMNGGTVDSAPNFTITHGAADHLTVTTQPSAATVSNVNFAQQPVVEVRDAQGNVVTTGNDATQTITASLNVGTGALAGDVDIAAVAGDVDIAAVAGVATFTDLNINLVGTNKVLRFSAGMNGGTVDSGAFTITHAAATRLVITTAPSASTVNFAQQPVVEVRDAQGNVVTTGNDATQTITASLNVGTGALAGDVDIAAVAGVATFTDLNINLVGTNEVLRFSAGMNGGTVDTAPNFAIDAGGLTDTNIFADGFESGDTTAWSFVDRPVRRTPLVGDRAVGGGNRVVGRGRVVAGSQRGAAQRLLAWRRRLARGEPRRAFVLHASFRPAADVHPTPQRRIRHHGWRRRVVRDRCGPGRGVGACGARRPARLRVDDRSLRPGRLLRGAADLGRGARARRRQAARLPHQRRRLLVGSARTGAAGRLLSGGVPTSADARRPPAAGRAEPGSKLV